MFQADIRVHASPIVSGGEIVGFEAGCSRGKLPGISYSGIQALGDRLRIAGLKTPIVAAGTERTQGLGLHVIASLILGREAEVSVREHPFMWDVVMILKPLG